MRNTTQKLLFIFGLGYSAQSVARAAIAQGFRVAGTCRTLEKCELLQGQGIEAIEFDKVSSDTLAGFSYVLSSIPPQENGDVVLGLLPKNNSWLGYFSTTGVYGDYGGEWVDEQSELRPNNDRLRRRIAAEEQWIKRGGQVFRLAGIYGKGRCAIDDVQAGKARRIDKVGQVFSRINIEDIAQVVLASMSKPNPQRIYNVCDDIPAPAHEVVAFACELLGKEPPPLVPFEQADLSPMGREFYSANRRVRNQRIKDELGVELLYPSYRTGLRALK